MRSEPYRTRNTFDAMLLRRIPHIAARKVSIHYLTL